MAASVWYDRQYQAAAHTEMYLTFWKRVVVVVEQLLAVERLQALQDAVADTAGANGADDLALEIERVARDRGHLPLAALDHLCETKARRVNIAVIERANAEMQGQ